MSRLCVLLAVSCVLAVAASRASAQDMPLVRSLVEKQFREELSAHNSQESAWYDEKSVDKKKYTSGKVLGRKIRLASWTEQSKTWFWLEDPATALSLELQRFAVVDARLQFALAANAKARFKVWGRIPKFAQASAGGTALVRFEIEGSTSIGKGGLTGSQITRFHGRLHDLRFNNDLAHPLEDLVKDAVNDYAQNKNDKLKRSVEKALDRVRF
jgi:hypothetical protein